MASKLQFSSISNNRSNSTMIQLDTFSPYAYLTGQEQQQQQHEIYAVCVSRRSTGGVELYYYSTFDGKGGAPDAPHARNEPGGVRFPTRGRLADAETRKEENRNSVFVAEILGKSGLDTKADGAGASFPPGVEATLTITSQREQTSVWCGFIKEGRLILRGGYWDEIDMRESIIAVLELAETFACTDVIVCIRRDDSRLSNLIHDFLYVGFEPVLPGMPLGAGLGGEDIYIRVGMEL
ncbi:LOW QUALITY PROTEIN: hypothetical protein BC937DRAFT_93878 [Endogone sp. FLAS-F59071]|nr:LOW QUALITY PROTEIN: hypothetical protein BC937DRAFT_93878 [Endogone sp. FLAS-F59071]|eukprot:RUS20999.1 LOW QUALITY PROTEIN: hypothetical protein BC937DRAFT_93878 [Endogone sp. FLAS-F59071]